MAEQISASTASLKRPLLSGKVDTEQCCQLGDKFFVCLFLISKATRENYFLVLFETWKKAVYSPENMYLYSEISVDSEHTFFQPVTTKFVTVYAITTSILV